MSKIEVQCPGCSSRLRLPRDARGKIVRCPVCQQELKLPPARPGTEAEPDRPALPQKPATREKPAGSPKPTGARSPSVRKRPRRDAVPAAPPDDPWESLPEDIDLFAEVDDAAWGDEDAYGAPAPAKRKSRRRQNSGNAVQVLLSLFMGLIAVGGLGGVGYVIYRFLPAGGIPGFGNVIDFAWLPPKTEAFVYCDVNTILNAPVLASLRNQSQGQENDLLSSFLKPAMNDEVLRPEDIDSVVMGLWKRPGAGGVNPMPPFAAMGAAGNDTDFIAVIRFNRSLSGINPPNSSAVSHGGTQYFARNDGTTAIWMPDSSTLVLGRSDSIEAAIDQGSSSLRFSQFDFANNGGDLMIAGVGRMDSSSSSSMSSPFGGMNNIEQQMKQSARGVSLGIDFTSQISVDGLVWCHQADQASSLAAEINRSVQQGLDQLQQSAGNPMMLPFMGHLKTVLGSVHASQSGDTVSVRAVIEKSTIDTIAGLVSSLAP